MSKFGVPTDEQLAKINKLAKRKLTKEEVFVFPSKLAGDMIIPNRYIQLQKELLDVYATDAKKGVSLLLDHSWSPDGFFGLGGRPKAAIPYGRTFDSRYESSTEEGETISLVADHYMVKGVEIDGIKTNDLAASIEAGTLFDTSIGFGFDKATCSVCGENYRSSKCSHYAGRTYEIEGDDGVTRNKLCYIKAEPPGYLMENSLVFDGAYPGAGVLSNVGDVGENENGVFEVVSDIKGVDPTKRILSIYSNRTGITTLVKKSDHKKVFKGGFVDNANLSNLNNDHVLPNNVANKLNNVLQIIAGSNGKFINLKGSESQMDEKVLKALEALGIEYQEGMNEMDILEKVAEKWNGSLKIADSVEELKFYMTQDQATEKLGAELSADEVLRLAKEGQEYHKSLSDEAIAMGVRAMGNDFPKETWEKSFEVMGTNNIKDIMKTWELQAEATIPAGRQTDPAAGQNQGVSIPAEAFKI